MWRPFEAQDELKPPPPKERAKSRSLGKLGMTDFFVSDVCGTVETHLTRTSRALTKFA
jgi:hypothetical protein